MKKKTIIFLLLCSIVFVGCHNKYQKINQKQVNKYFEENIKEDYEIISKTKTQKHPDHVLYKMKSLERDLEFEIETYICFQDYGLPTTETCISSEYERAIGNYYKPKVIAAINKYFNESKYSLENETDYEKKYIPVSYTIDIKTKEDIDNFINLIEDVKKIYAEEKNYTSDPYTDIIIIKTQYCEVSIGANDSKEEVLATIYQSLADKQVQIPGVDIGNYHKKTIEDVYVNGTKSSYKYHRIKYNNDKYYVDLFESYTGATDYSSLSEYLKLLKVDYKSVNNDYNNYLVDKTISFTLNGSYYEISFYKDEKNDGVMTILKDGNTYNVDYYYASSCQFMVDIDDFSRLLNLSYQEDNGVITFTSK